MAVGFGVQVHAGMSVQQGRSTLNGDVRELEQVIRPFLFTEKIVNSNAKKLFFYVTRERYTDICQRDGSPYFG